MPAISSRCVWISNIMPCTSFHHTTISVFLCRATPRGARGPGRLVFKARTIGTSHSPCSLLFSLSPLLPLLNLCLAADDSVPSSPCSRPQDVLLLFRFAAPSCQIGTIKVLSEPVPGRSSHPDHLVIDHCPAALQYLQGLHYLQYVQPSALGHASAFPTPPPPVQIHGRPTRPA